MKRAKTVDGYIAEAETFGAELTKLRKILVATRLEETVKWGAPCYTVGGKNVIGLAAFKEHVALWFHQGALLEDPRGVLIAAQAKTKALRQWRFTSAKGIVASHIKPYVQAAIALAEEGREIKPARSRPVVVPPELKRVLASRKRAGTSFSKMTVGKRREYADYIAEAKRDATKQRRLEKILPMIEAGVGLHDKYRDC